MSNQKYDARFHSSVVRNIRQVWIDTKQTEELKLTDEQVWDVFLDCYFDDGPEDEKYLAGLKNANAERKKL